MYIQEYNSVTESYQSRFIIIYECDYEQISFYQKYGKKN